MKLLKIFKISFSNTLKNRKRSIVTLLSIFICVLFLILLLGMTEGYSLNVINNYVQTTSGAIQIHKKSFYENTDQNKSQYFSVKKTTKIKNLPGVTGVSGRLIFQAVFTDGKNQAHVLVSGINLNEENKVCPERTKLRVNRDSVNDISKGYILIDDEIGKNIIEMNPNEKISNLNFSLSAVSPNGRENILDFKVVGLVQSPIQFYKSSPVVMTLEDAQELFDSKELINEVVVSTVNPKATSDLEHSIQNILGDSYDVRNWQETNSVVRSTTVFFEIIFRIIIIIVFCMCILFVKNTTLSNFKERRLEIGLMMSLGIEKKVIFQLFLFESLIISTMAACLSVFFAYIIQFIINSLEIEMPTVFTLGLNYINIKITHEIVLFSFVCSILISIFSGIYPTVKLQNLPPSEAIREE